MLEKMCRTGRKPALFSVEREAHIDRAEMCAENGKAGRELLRKDQYIKPARVLYRIVALTEAVASVHCQLISQLQVLLHRLSEFRGAYMWCQV